MPHLPACRYADEPAAHTAYDDWQRTIVDTGEVIPVKNPQGYITYGNDGRMMVIIVRHPRPKPERIETATDQERADLLRTMTAYAGTYKFDGAKIEQMTADLSGVRDNLRAATSRKDKLAVKAAAAA